MYYVLLLADLSEINCGRIAGKAEVLSTTIQVQRNNDKKIKTASRRRPLTELRILLPVLFNSGSLIHTPAPNNGTHETQASQQHGKTFRLRDG